MYVGPSASLSFLQALRNTFVRRAGTLYTEREGESEALLDAELTNQDDANLSDWCDSALLFEYIDCFFSTVSAPCQFFSVEPRLSSIIFGNRLSLVQKLV